MRICKVVNCKKETIGNRWRCPKHEKEERRESSKLSVRRRRKLKK